MISLGRVTEGACLLFFTPALLISFSFFSVLASLKSSLTPPWSGAARCCVLRKLQMRYERRAPVSRLSLQGGLTLNIPAWWDHWNGKKNNQMLPIRASLISLSPRIRWEIEVKGRQVGAYPSYSCTAQKSCVSLLLLFLLLQDGDSIPSLLRDLKEESNPVMHWYYLQASVCGTVCLLRALTSAQL